MRSRPTRSHLNEQASHSNRNYALRSAIAPPPLRQGSHMQILSARHVKTEESLRLGVVSGWYSTKVSGTFVTGPHATQEDCLSKILELNPPPARKVPRPMAV